MVPQVTMALYAYNQAPYIVDAMNSLLRQDLTEYHIIISDDCSTDGTYELMEAFADANRGLRKITLNRNTQRLGIGGQLNAICRLAETELIILCGGDDRSLPQRARRCLETWLADPKRSYSITSAAWIIDSEGRRTGARLPGKASADSISQGVFNRYHGVYGAAQAMTKSVWTEFGDFLPRLLLEDNSILLRSHILGGFTHVDEELVEYRVHRDNSCRLPDSDVQSDQFFAKTSWYHNASALVYSQFLADLYAPAAEFIESAELRRSRFAAMYRGLDHQISFAHYQKTYLSDEMSHYKNILQLLIQALKSSIKSRVPAIDRRNAARAIRQRASNQY
jgi:glycosyltransferase involved in cell wall biosynthesis